MRKAALIGLWLLLFMILTGCGSDGSDQLEYSLQTVDGEEVYFVIGIKNDSATKVVIPETYEDRPVMGIGDHAFKNCEELKSVSIPDGAIYIGKSAFDNCYSLKEVRIPDSMTYIGGYAFCNCESLASIHIPENVTRIEAGTFFFCRALAEVNIPDGVTYIGPDAFYTCNTLTSIIIPDNVTYIGEGAFSCCEKLTDVSIGSQVTTISTNAFAYTPALQSENGVLYIDTWVVDCSSSPTSVTIREGTTGIRDYAFWDCRSLTSITIPDSVIYIGKEVFKDSPLKEATIPSMACAYIRSATLEKVTVTSGTSLEDHAFQDCTALRSVTLADSITHISNTAFEGCPDLFQSEYGVQYLGDRVMDCNTAATTLTLREGTRIIGNEAFGYCQSLTSVTIPQSVTDISYRAFFYCGNLRSITFEGTVAEWQAITKASGWDACTPKYTVQCTDGTV